MKIFSPSSCDFYPPELQPDYERAGTWPTDGIEVSDEVFRVCVAARADGKIIAADPEGEPFITEPPPPPIEDVTRLALSQRDQLLAAAAVQIGPLQDADDLGEATDDEAALLKAWKRYRVDLNRITQQAGFPHTIDWPVIPTGAAV